MPNDTIDRAIKKGTGDLDGVSYEEFNYEVFGPGGTAVLVEVMTDNRNRTAGDIRSVITRHGGNLGASGSVAYMFKKQGLIVFEKSRRRRGQGHRAGHRAGRRRRPDRGRVAAGRHRAEGVRDASARA